MVLKYINYDTSIIPKRIKLAMQHRDMKRRELAWAMGYDDPGSISQYLVEIPTNPTKQRVPNLETLCKFANALDCDLEYFLGALPEGVYHRADYDVMKVTGLSEKAVSNLTEYHSVQKNNSITLAVCALLEERSALFAISRYLFYKPQEPQPQVLKYRYEENTDFRGSYEDRAINPTATIELVGDDEYAAMLMLELQQRLHELLEIENGKNRFDRV